MMSQGKSFSDHLKDYGSVGTSTRTVSKTLDELCNAIGTYTKGEVVCRRLPGHVTNLGQEYRIILSPRGSKFDHVLLRAHVPASEFPVHLDLYDEDLVECRDDSSLRAALGAFLDRETTKEVIQSLANQ